MHGRDLNERLVTRVLETLAAQRISQGELARRAGMSHMAVNRRLRGEVPMNLDEVEQFAEALEIPAERLLIAS